MKRINNTLLVFLSCCFFFLNLISIAYAQDPKGYSSIWGDNKGAIASVSPIATQAGIDAFENGGNAIDAALAVAFTLGVVDSANSGIGGGLFILVRKADGTVQAIDGREMAPAAAHKDMFIRGGKAVPALSKTGALAIGIPGSVAALHELQKSSGKLSFSDVVLPAAKVAEQGFVVDAALAKRLKWTEKAIKQFPETASILLNEKGDVLQEGDLLVQKDLAKTYKKLAKKGPDYFYRGGFAKKVAKWMKKNGGIVTKDDFANYKTVYREPLKTEFVGYSIFGFPPPSSGGIHVAQILNILETFDLASLSEVDRYHLYIEAMKLAFADRAYWLGDSDFVDVPKGLIDRKYAKTLSKLIDLKSASKVDGHHTPEDASTNLFDKHTTHVSVADAEGNWVAITTTLNTSFGSKVTIPGTGVLMNNQMDDFSAQPGVANAFGLVGAEANRVEARKRPLSSMSPTIVMKDGKPVFTVGAAGGPTIITQVLQALVNRLAFEQSAKQSLETVRVHHQWRPNTVFIDSYADRALWQSLEKKGHTLKKWPPFGATQAISIENGVFEAATEPRLLSGNR